MRIFYNFFHSIFRGSGGNKLNKIKKINKSKNIVIGFGITSKTIASLKRADGLVVGSEICKEISKSIKNKQNSVTNVTNIVKRLREKIL